MVMSAMDSFGRAAEDFLRGSTVSEEVAETREQMQRDATYGGYILPQEVLREIQGWVQSGRIY
jgi:hypothetical protein